MTRAEALAEARRRWGRGTKVEILKAPNALPSSWRFFIWRLLPGRPWKSYESVGSGPSWEAAFADADRRSGEVGR